ncbi:MAG: alginate export family protein [FCB group bacterium]|nr:alginate export family protein [FCB group bacterium]
MKKALTAVLIGLLFSGLFAGTSFDLSGQMRYRFEWEAKDFDSNTNSHNFSLLRTRLNFDLKPSYDQGVFIQLQDSRLLGEERNPGADPYSNVTLTDGSADKFDLHQGYFYLKSLFGLCLDFKVGRMEAPYPPERILGAVGWSNIGRSFDGIFMKYYWMYGTVDIFNFKEIDPDQVGADKDLLGAYVNFNMPETYKFYGFFLDETKYKWDRYSAGFYTVGDFGKWYHETEFAYQFGEDVTNNFNYKAYMYAFNVGVRFDPYTLSAGIDFLSGDDPGTADYESFFNGYATNHKYYGFMDYFVLNGASGLQDLHIKFDGLRLLTVKTKADFHIFSADQDVAGNSSYGNELDLTFTQEYSSNTKFVAGFSLFTPGDIMKATMGKDTSTWFYFMTIVNF